MFTQVASHTRHIPSLNGNMVRPFGRFPSPRSIPVGSSTDGTTTVCRARLITSLSAVWRRCRPALKRHVSACSGPDCPPGIHSDIDAAGRPWRRREERRRLLRVGGPSREPRLAEGSECSQAPLSAVPAAKSRARPSRLTVETRRSRILSASNKSQARWLRAASSARGSTDYENCFKLNVISFQLGRK